MPLQTLLAKNEEQPQSSSLALSDTTNRARIILAESNAELRSQLQQMLQPHHTVEAFSTGIAALQAASKNPPDILLTDFATREIGGLKWLRELRADEKLRATPVILLTDDTGEEQGDGILNLADDFVRKPVNARELLARVATQLRLKQARFDALAAVEDARSVRQQAEQTAAALREKEERLRAALTASETGTFRWNIRTNELDWDESLDHLFGLPPGQTVRSLETFIARVHPDDRQGVIDRCQRCASEGTDFDMEFRVIWPDGTMHWLDDKGKTFFDKDGLPLYMTGACIEITARKAYEEALLKSRQRFDIVKDVSQVGFWFCDLPFDKLNWDNRVKEHFWFTPETDVTIELFYEHLHPDDRERTRTQIEHSIANHTRYDIEYRTVNPKGGEVKWIRAIGQGFYDEKNQPIRFDGVTLDITDRKQTQKNLEHIVTERTEKLRETMGELESYSYSIVHDLRAPLRSMQGFSNLLRDEYADKLGEDGAMYLQRISNSAERMDRLIQDVLTFSRVARSDLTLAPVNTDKLVHDIVETYPNLRNHKDCIAVNGALPTVNGNEAGLTQCFSNLIGNAVKFVAPGTRPRIRIWSEVVDGSARIFIEDKGIGIAEIAHDGIFKLFHRATVEYEGTGIGLAVVKKTVERMGGSVGFRSELGKGSSFWLELKLA